MTGWGAPSPALGTTTLSHVGAVSQERRPASGQTGRPGSASPPANGRIAVRVVNVHHDFGSRRSEVHALTGVSFTVGAGTVVGLLGPNGAGKTTVIELVSGLRAVQEGTIALFDQGLPAGHPATRHRLGFLPQRSVLYEDVTVYDNLRFAADLHRSSRERVDAVLDIVGLADRRRSLVSSLSGGMQRRVAIARALVHEPELLVLDEPTLGVDSDNRHRIWQYIRAVRRSGVTVLLSSNYLDEVEALCDHVVVLGSGRVVGQLSPDELFRRAGWWLEAECADDGFPDLVFICRRQAALEVIVEQPAVRLRFADAASAHRSMTDLVASGVVSSVRQRRPDLVEIFAGLRNGG